MTSPVDAVCMTSIFSISPQYKNTASEKNRKRCKVMKKNNIPYYSKLFDY